MTTNSSELVSVAAFRSIADAEMAKGILDEAGVESMIRSDNAGGMYPAIDAAYLLVRAEDVNKANEALAGLADDAHEPPSHGDTEV